MELDYGHKMADDELQKLERKLKREYKKAYQESKKKAEEYLKKFQEEDKKRKKLVDDGEMTEKDYQKWRQGKMMMNKRWESLKNSLSEEMNEVSRYANGEIYQHSANVFAENYNFGQYEIAARIRGGGTADISLNTSFTLYDKNTVLNLAKNKPDLLPKPGKKTAEAIAQKKIKKWRNQTLQSVMMQGILQGLSIPDIADKLASSLTIKDMNVAIRTARTMTTSAENAGRLEGYKHADNLGIKVNKMWIATLDSRTRHSHRQLDGVSIPKEENFENGLKFPADPNGAPAEVYNCRCTLIADFPKYRTNARDMSLRNTDRMQEDDYQKWKDALKKEEKKKNPVEEVKHTGEYEAFLNYCKSNRVGFKEVEELTEVLDEDAIIERLGGGDLTKGSCMSLACAYAGNRFGLDVLDFRGGRDTFAFANYGNILKILKFDNVVSFREEHFNAVKAARAVLKNVEDGKEYILTVGAHAAVVRKNPETGVLEYLELQSGIKNGFRPLTDVDGLRKRFGAKMSRTILGTKVSQHAELIDIESLGKSKDFREALGYLNTDADKQRKGKMGHER